MGTNCHSATKYHYSILNVNFATVHNNFGNNISTASSASAIAIAAATVKQFRQQQQLILIFNIHICQILALVQNRRKKNQERSMKEKSRKFPPPIHWFEKVPLVTVLLSLSL